MADLPQKVFTASDSLGWVYQFWQAKKKDEVNDSDVKIGAKELPAVTQLFTEPYMVCFLLDNTLGAWWAVRRLTDFDLKNSKSENELRKKAAISGVPLIYLRFLQKEDGTWMPAGGTFENWPKDLRELKILDPCCGSGHFLVAAFLMLVSIRIEQDGLSPRQAVDAVISENLNGLEIDKRCVELAVFSLAMAAWCYPGSGGYRQLPDINIACSGLSLSAKKDRWLSFADDNDTLRSSLEDLYRIFSNAPILGSLINPAQTNTIDRLFKQRWEDIVPHLNRALSEELKIEDDEMKVVAQGIFKAAQILTSNFEWVITNVPYLSRGKQDIILKNHIETYYSDGKPDLATAFLLRCLDFTSDKGIVSLVLPRIWMTYTKYYQNLRKFIVKNSTMLSITPLGKRAFETISGEIVDVALLNACNKIADSNHTFFRCDASHGKNSEEKSQLMIETELDIESQVDILDNPGCVLLAGDSERNKLLSGYVKTYEGLSRGDAKRFDRCFWEIQNIDENGWEVIINSDDSDDVYWGRHSIFLWENGEGQLRKCNSARIQGEGAFGKEGVFVSRTHLNACLTYGDIHAQNGVAIIPKDPELLPAILCFCKSDEYKSAIKELNQKLIKPTGVMDKVNFDPEHWCKIASKKYNKGLPKPYTDNPAEFAFHGHPAYSINPFQVSVMRLLGFRWPSEKLENLMISNEAKRLMSSCVEMEKFTDRDGIICIPSIRGEASAADRILNLLAFSFNKSWNVQKLEGLLKKVDHPNKSLESWLRDKFFIQHCKLFRHRPIIWQIWDGLNDGFSALINYHMLDRKNLENLIFSYLGEWIKIQKNDIKENKDGAHGKLDAAESLKGKLELILNGENPYDIFIRWKPIHMQPIGWEPDLNDGVAVNIRPFVMAPDVKKSGAGVLRDRVNINWKKDKGHDDPSAPWYDLGPMYKGNKGDRVNDHHLSISEKMLSKQ